MKIDRTELQKLLQIYGTEQARREESKRDKAKAPEEGVTLSLSPEALSLNRLREELRQLPEVREERVRDLKEKIERGEYRPDPRKIAEGMLQEHRLDRRV
ncbi:anti-sigma-28 factor, FlgM [Ammonifex degensii KC4]|uniref:Negative regulator of flagellin synthesis n=1 Tax=Ammonifex degensii (strain DSM 10501 / KC4) TaxID=429009 RepID=C9RAY7_AMMDK|nr:flagellar biosynthesis anti-sigma factor FlgM [Ammonifex degensii]ACX51414.1 anti-sigma-28 factor, FlgM [Ammonifex degensii KC4]